MCDRCTVIECAFGSRDPLPPRIASLNEDPTIFPPVEINKTSHGDEHDTDVKSLASSGTATLVLQPYVSTSSGTCTSTFVTSQERTVTALIATSSEVHTPGPNAYVKWSDVAGFGSKAFQLRATTKYRETAMQYTILVEITKNVDILDALMLNCPDFPTLFALVASCKAAKSTFEQHSQGIITTMLRKMPQELRYLTVALIGINGSKIGNSKSIKTLMGTWLGMGPKPLAERLQEDPIEIIRKLARSFSAIDLFSEVIPKNCANNFTDYKKVVTSREGLDLYDVAQMPTKHPLLQQTEWSDVSDDTEWNFAELPSPEVGPQDFALPLTDGENYRIKRALLRYEIFCGLFYLGPDKYFDTRRHPHRFNQEPDSSRRRAFCKDQIIFLNEYVNPWEVGELAVVTHFMYDLVRNAYFHEYKTLRYDEAYKSWYGRWGNKFHGRNRHDDHEDVVDEFDNYMVWFTSQGLSLLRKIYDDRKAGYSALTDKHCEPHYRLAECFIPFEKCADRRGYGFASDPGSCWKPRKVWSDTPGMELPSKGWLGKSPAADETFENTAYWGEKWMRKIGYYLWDRD